MRADLTDGEALRSAVSGACKVIHLASLPGGAAEKDPCGSRRINLDVALNLIACLAERRHPVRFVYASSIAVLGGSLSDPVDDDTPANPQSIYGTHKRMVELALSDASRRGPIDGFSLRLPGIVARPRGKDGLGSAFMSDIFWAIHGNQPYTLPVGAGATMWLMSAQCCADNILHAAGLPRDEARPRTVTLPALRVSMADLIAAIVARSGDARAIRYRPDPATGRMFGSYPPLRTQAAEALGFGHDQDIDALVGNALMTAEENGAVRESGLH